MKVYTKKDHKNPAKAKIMAFENHWTHGINRRKFLKGSVAASLLASIAACKPSADHIPKIDTVKAKPLINQTSDVVEIPEFTFTNKQHLDLQAVYMHLFPDDGDGPSANDLNVLTYLEWAMTDKQNIEDGDPEFIKTGLGWLNQFANDKHSKEFIELEEDQQSGLLTTTSKSDAGRNWMSVLIYYLIEALTLDPFYGGNTNQAGWQWLQYQGGFPNPVKGKTYRDFT